MNTIEIGWRKKRLYGVEEGGDWLAGYACQTLLHILLLLTLHRSLPFPSKLSPA